LIDEVRKKSEVEFIADFAYPYAGALIGHITGTGETQDLQELRHWLELLEQLSSVRPDDSTVAATETAIRKEAKYFDAVIQDRRSNPRQDLVSALVSTDIDGNSLTSAELRSALDLLITAGLGTTNYTLCNAVLLLSKDKALFATLKLQPELIAAFVEELLRFDPATHCLLRKTVSAVDLEGVTIPADSLVAVLIGSANRDERVFENPNEFILHRENSREHLSFGFGPHVCVGSALARLELRIALQMLLANFDNISTPHHRDLQWINSLTTHGLRLLPVRFS
jgi:cytochrome P450